MLVDEQVRKCVAFLFSDIQDMRTGTARRVPVGTAFLVAVPVDEAAGMDGAGVIYLVTARHVLDGTRQYGPLSVRFNRKDHDWPVDFWVPHDEWTCHPTTDVAVVPISIPFNEYDVLWLAPDLLVTDEFVQTSGLSEGDDVFFVSLFVQHVGRQRIQPILRFGNISLMPREPIPIKIDPSPQGAEVWTDAYLVEARSWGGHSGAPAFADFNLLRPAGSYVYGEGLPDIQPRLLGLVHGHYNVAQNVTLQGAFGTVPLNAGIAIVIPAQHILETLNLGGLVEEREQVAKQQMTVPEADVAPAGVEDDLSEFDRFEQLTQQLVNTPKPGKENAGE